MSDISEQEPSNTIGELSKALSSEVGKAERVSKHCSKIDTTTTPAEKEERSVNKSSSCEINGEDNLKTTIRNFSKQIQELQQERLSTSFQHRRFYSNPNPLRLENGLPKYYHHSHSQSTKRLRSQVYTKKTKKYSNIRFPSDSQISSYQSSSDEEYSHHDKKVHFMTTNSRKAKYSSHQFHKKYKKSTSPVKGPTSPVRENVSPVRGQRKSTVSELSLSPVREYHSPVRVASKTGKKRKDENNDQEKRKKIRPNEEVFNQYVPQTDGYDS